MGSYLRDVEGRAAARAVVQAEKPAGAYGPALWLLGLGLLGLAVASLLPGRAEVQAYAVLASPMQGQGRAFELVAAAGGAVVQATRLGGVVIARSERRDFVDALYEQGAWLVFVPPGRWGCAAYGGQE